MLQFWFSKELLNSLVNYWNGIFNFMRSIPSSQEKHSVLIINIVAFPKCGSFIVHKGTNQLM